MDDRWNPERRATADCRVKARGGRRPDDLAGLSPLVLVVGNAQERESECGVILSRLHFAVAPATDVAEALRVIDAVHPDLIVAGPSSAEHLRRDRTIALPLVEFDPAREDGDVLVERIRSAMRVQTSDLWISRRSAQSPRWMLQITSALAIPESDLEERFVRASGPGGQNVNKVLPRCSCVSTSTVRRASARRYAIDSVVWPVAA